MQDIVRKRGFAAALVLLVILSLGGGLAGGCREHKAVQRAGESVTTDVVNQSLLDWVSGILSELDRYESSNALTQVVIKLNQWIESGAPQVDWQPDPLLAKLPNELKDLPAVKELADQHFAEDDGAQLQEVLWLHNAAKHAIGHEKSDLVRARLLFDWAVRNVVLDAKLEGSPAAQVRRPRQSLLTGRGTVADRLWIFTLLARQVGLDVVAIETAEGQPLRLAGLLKDGELYLFDAQYGIPLPGPGGKGTATLSAAAKDDAVLRQLDLPDAAYPLKSGDLAHATALIEASPIYLSKRMKQVQTALSADRRWVLSARPSKVAERLKSVANVGEVRLWTLPLERLKTPDKLADEDKQQLIEEIRVFLAMGELAQGRVRQLQGKFTGKNGAITFLQRALPSEDLINTMREKAEGAEQRKNLNDAQQQELFERVALHVRTVRRAKLYATFWLGVVAQERGTYKVATDYFGRKTLVDSNDETWGNAAQYNLGRSFEEWGKKDKEHKTAEAVAAYRKDESAQRPGSLLRAKWLESGNVPDTLNLPEPLPEAKEAIDPPSS